MGHVLLSWEAIYILGRSAMFEACVPVVKPWVLIYFFILINIFLVIECVSVLRYLKGRFINILFIMLAIPLHLIDF